MLWSHPSCTSSSACLPRSASTGSRRTSPGTTRCAVCWRRNSRPRRSPKRARRRPRTRTGTSRSTLRRHPRRSASRTMTATERRISDSHGRCSARSETTTPQMAGFRVSRRRRLVRRHRVSAHRSNVAAALSIRRPRYRGKSFAQEEPRPRYRERWQLRRGTPHGSCRLRRRPRHRPAALGQPGEAAADRGGSRTPKAPEAQSRGATGSRLAAISMPPPGRWTRR